MKGVKLIIIQAITLKINLCLEILIRYSLLNIYPIIWFSCSHFVHTFMCTLSEREKYVAALRIERKHHNVKMKC